MGHLVSSKEADRLAIISAVERMWRKTMFAENIKRLRNERGWSQAMLAKVLETTKGTVSVWERGVRMPDMNVLQKICAIFHISMGELVDEFPELNVEKKPETEDAMKELVRRTIELSFMELKIQYPQYSTCALEAVLLDLVKEVAKGQEI